MYPCYLNLSKRELNFRIKKLFKILENCQLCPRKCHVNRLKNEKGFCQLGFLPMVSAYHPHFGEEKALVGPLTDLGRGGSGTIFFTSCNLACVYCQNYEISQLRIGKEISFERLAEMMIDLQERGCHNINFVSPTPQVPQIVKALSIAREKGLKLPLVYNTNTYDSVETLKLLDGIIDIYMPDAKYSDDKIALKYSNALYPVRSKSPKAKATAVLPTAERTSNRAGYFKIMKVAIKEMHCQVGDLILDKKGIATKGLLVRHLVLPNNLAGSEKIFEFLAKEISKNTFLNIMNQYYSTWKAFQYPELSRRITNKEYQEAIQLTKKAGLKRLINHYE